jgi:N-acyl-D-amino-acid deacylase
MTLLQYPDAAVACDCGATTSTRTHPRNYGTYPRVLGRYVRERGVLTWEDAIRKMTGLPASIVGMVERGFLVAGMVADITVFDPETVIDHATYEDPARLSDGIRHVLVDGRLALRDGAVTGVQAGATLTRTIHMPSRPMSTHSTREVATDGLIDVARLDAAATASVRMSFDVRQGSDGRGATGTFRLQDGNTEVRMEDVGLLQVAPGWATFSGTGRVGDVERAIIVVLDEGYSGATRASVSVDVDGVYSFSGTLPPGTIRFGGIASGVGNLTISGERR